MSLRSAITSVRVEPNMLNKNQFLEILLATWYLHFRNHSAGKLALQDVFIKTIECLRCTRSFRVFLREGKGEVNRGDLHSKVFVGMSTAKYDTNSVQRTSKSSWAT